MSKDKTPNNMGDFDAINEVVDEVTAENSLHNEGRTTKCARAFWNTPCRSLWTVPCPMYGTD